MSQPGKDGQGKIPFNQLRLLLLSMAAVEANDQKRVKRIEEEAARLGIKVSAGSQAVLAVRSE